MDNRLETNLGIMFALLPNHRGTENVVEHHWSNIRVLMFDLDAAAPFTNKKSDENLVRYFNFYLDEKRSPKKELSVGYLVLVLLLRV